MELTATPVDELRLASAAAADLVGTVSPLPLLTAGLERIAEEVATLPGSEVVIKAPPPKVTSPHCVPPVGTVASQVHRVPDARPHWPCTGDHVHYLKRQAAVPGNRCFWQRSARSAACLPQGGQPSPAPGEVEL